VDLTFYFNNDVNYLDGICDKQLLTLFQQSTICCESNDLIVIEVEGIEIYFHDHGMVRMNCKNVKHVLPTIENALTKYMRLHEHDKRFKFPYVFKCFVEQKDIGKIIHALEEVGVQYETRELSDKVTVEIYQKATLY